MWNLARQYKLLLLLCLLSHGVFAVGDRAVFRVAGQVFFQSDIVHIKKTLQGLSSCMKSETVMITSFALAKNKERPYLQDLYLVKLMIAAKAESSVQKDKQLKKIYGKCLTASNKAWVAADDYLRPYRGKEKDLMTQVNQLYPHYFFKNAKQVK